MKLSEGEEEGNKGIYLFVARVCIFVTRFCLCSMLTNE